MNVTIPLPLNRLVRCVRCDEADGPCTPDQLMDQAMNDLAEQDPPPEPIDVAALVGEAETRPCSW